MRWFCFVSKAYNQDIKKKKNRMGLPFIRNTFSQAKLKGVPCHHSSGRVCLNLPLLPPSQVLSVCQVNWPGEMQCSLEEPTGLCSPPRQRKQTDV